MNAYTEKMRNERVRKNKKKRKQTIILKRRKRNRNFRKMEESERGYADRGRVEQSRAERHAYFNGTKKSLKQKYPRIAWPRTVKSQFKNFFPHSFLLIVPGQEMIHQFF